MAFTISRYLKLKIGDDLSSDAKYNLEKIDSLGAVFARDTESDTNVRSSQNIALLPEDPSIGGSGNNSGSITLGDSNNKATITAHSVDFFLRSALSFLNQSTSVGTVNYLKIRFLNDTDITADRTLTVDVNGADRNISFPVDGEVVTADGVQTLVDKTISGNDNIFSDIGYSSLVLTNGIVNADISPTAAIADSKLDTITTSGKVSNSATTATSANTPNAIVARDGAGNFAAGAITAASFIGDLTGNVTGNLTGNVTGNVSGTASNVTGIVDIVNGGTNASTASQARTNLGVIASNILPSYTGNALGTLRVNSTETDVEWVIGAGQGTVTGVTATSPLVVTNNPNLDPNISLPQATALVNGYLSSTDWSTFNSKQAAITGAATSITSSNLTASVALVSDSGGKVASSSVTATELSYLSGVTSSVQTQLGSKEPTITAGTTLQYWRGDKSWQTPIVNSTAGTETDQAPSVAAVKAYVSAQGGGAVSYTWSTADGVTKSIAHNLNKATISVSIYDENGEDILVDTVDRTDNNNVSLTSSEAPTGNWTVIIRP